MDPQAESKKTRKLFACKYHIKLTPPDEIKEGKTRCHNGNKCIYPHPTDPGEVSKALTRLFNHEKKPQTPCRSWMSYGTCDYGDKCRYKHPKIGSDEYIRAQQDMIKNIQTKTPSTFQKKKYYRPRPFIRRKPIKHDEVNITTNDVPEAVGPTEKTIASTIVEGIPDTISGIEINEN